MREIGSYYYLTEGEIRRLLEDQRTLVWTPDVVQDVRLFSLGRDALAFCLDDISQNGATALLPAFTSKSLVNAFIERDYRLVFYPIDEDMTVKTSVWNRLIEREAVDVVLFHPYYGFDTIIQDEYPITEDVIYLYDGTHGWRGGLVYDFTDYAFCSLRNWGPLPDGAFASKREGHFIPEMPTEQDSELVRLMMHAYHMKARYIDGGDGKREDVIQAFGQVEEHIHQRTGAYRISDASMQLLCVWGHDHWREARAIQRRVNYRYLYEHADWSEIGTPVFEIRDEVPLFLPVMVKPGMRSFWYRELIKHGIYCAPVWSKPEQLELNKDMEAVASIYENCLCFPIDQRYSVEDMHRIVAVIQDIGFKLKSK
ncbi:MAG: hypothetical protein ACOYH4_04090 [Saccharofermentanales bacterium]|jgi:hypothetical protein